MTQKVEVGTIVRVMAPGSRESNGESVMIPAIVMKQWPDGQLQLYCFHFTGDRQLANVVPLADVEIVKQPTSALKFEMA